MTSRIATVLALAAVSVGAQQGAPQGRGPKEKHVVDAAAADRARKIWAADCITCHGTLARGGDGGPNLIQSVIVLRDRYGDEVGPYLRKGHPRQSGQPSAGLTDEQIRDLSHFLHQRVYETLRSSPTFAPGDILVGDAEAGAKYFDSEGKCVTCHSPTTDLKGIGSRYPPVAVQQRFVFPRAGRGAKPVSVTVTPAGSAPVTGDLVQMDDFNVSLRDASGQYYSWRRTSNLTVVKKDPYQAHIELLDRITDEQMHDVVAFLVRLK